MVPIVFIILSIWTAEIPYLATSAQHLKLGLAVFSVFAAWASGFVVGYNGKNS